MIARMPANRVVPLVAREVLGGGHFLLTYRHLEAAGEARPGQFVMIKAGISAEPPLRRPFSILSTDAARETVTLFVKAVGPGSRRLCAMAEGDLAQCLGPLGRPFTATPAGVEALLVAGGYGVAPLRFLCDELRSMGGRATLFYGGRTGGDLVLLDRLGGPGVRVVPATEDGSLGERGRVTVPLEAHLDAARETVTLFVKAIGPGSRRLCAMSEGDQAQCLGPLGRPFTPPPPGVDALLVAGGYGVAPLRFLCDELRGTGGRAALFYGGRTGADLVLLDRLGGPGVTVVPATEDGSLGERGRVTVPLEAHLDAARGSVRLYACGPDAMMHAVARIASARSLEAEVSLDAWMGCGVGTCLGCVVRVQAPSEGRWKYRCACTEGPVFDSARVLWPGEDESRARSTSAREARR